MPDLNLTAEPRSQFGKGAARRTRRAGKIPAVLYGHGMDPLHIALPGHQTMLALKHDNALITLDLEGSSRLALVKDVQRDPVRQVIEHVDMVVVRRGERVTVDVAVHVVGEAAAETVVTVETQALSVEAEATHIPETVEIDVTGASGSTQVLAREVPLPSGTTLVTDGDVLVVNVTAAATAEQVEADLAESEAELGIEHEASQEEIAATEAGEPEAAGAGERPADAPE